MANDKKSVAEPNSSLEKMSKGLELTKSLLGGTSAMRAKGQKYLPKEPNEEQRFYENRLRRTVLFNGFAKTRTVLAGKATDNGIGFSEEPNGQFKEWLENIDLEGNDLSQFGYEWFKRGLGYGLDHVLVDMPRPVPREDGQPLTVEDELAQNIRPYVVPVLAENLLGWKSENIGGVQVLTQVRISEVVIENVPDDEFNEVEIEQIRVLDIGRVRIYRKDIKTNEWLLFDEWTTSFDFIPFVPFYANKTGFLEGTSPLMDLAHLNIDHWQKSSDLSNILHLIQVPILVASGVPKDKHIKVGPNTLVKFNDTDGKLEYIEPTGNGTDLGMKNLESIEEQMAVMGASMLVEKSGNKTATEKAINEGGSNSDLAAIAKNFEDSVNTVFQFMGAMTGVSDIPVVRMNTDYGVPGNNAVTVEQLLKMRVAGEISHETFMNLLNDLTGFEINSEEELAALEQESPTIEGNDKVI